MGDDALGEIGKDLMLPCLYCGKKIRCAPDSPQAQGIFNVFCPDDDCEDRYAASL